MPRKLYVTLCLIGVFVLGGMIYLLYKQSNTNNAQYLQNSPSHTPSNSNELATIETERTAIAIFTQNPTLALSSTPFYAQIIYNEIERNLTEVPLPNRPCYLNPTDVPSNPATPIDECGPFIATMSVSSTARELVELMQEVNIEGTAGIESYGVEQIDESGNLPFVAVQSRLGFAIPVDTISNRSLIIEIIEKLTDLVVQNWANLEYVSTNAEIYIQFDASDGSVAIHTTYNALHQAHQSRLSGEALIEAIGGFVERWE